ncbi:N-acetyl-6-hydroxytryptophan oxidase ivoB [Colletotrichum orbiculare MAFF 240422]|uniref:N-acetyl-6-hydroxytryptophan oxidase ivoB n=1 Tax=Colletotrichum orbiculare (strain 104-T / ATCC 96160 / CBS 514.97 / LARS 414 / MAFF 240422) TaxID=1213857 RepID=N4UX86_COLOR|nr:N-acetyl-6-hydroxytryptophan oxidase ivoB [Colletotrichum orbiculare MAFF 240422]
MSKLLTIATAALAAAQAVSAACTNPSVRKDWTALTDAEKAAYIESTLCLMDPAQAPSKTNYAGSKSRWDELQVAHIAQVQFIHGVGAFLPWHRWFMSVHESLLRQDCGYTGPMPYWNEQVDQAAGPLTAASIWGSDPTTSFGTGATDANGCVADGPFSNLTYNVNIQLERGEDQCLAYGLNQAQFNQVAQTVVDACNSLETYDDFNTCLGGTPHTSGHYAIGGTMDDVSLSPADPLFFMHHTNLDRLWWVWQSKNESRINDMSGRNVAVGGILVTNQPKILPVSAFQPYFEDNGNVTTLNHVMWMAGTAENITIGEVVDVNSDAICIEYQ